MKKNKQLVPKRRFKGFENKYSLVKVEDEFNFIKNYSYSRNDEGRGKYHHIHYGDIHSKYSVYLDNSVSIPSIKSKEPHTELIFGDIIIADASENYKDLGKAVILLDEGKRKNIAGLHTFALRPKGQIDSLYFVYYSKTSQYKKYMSRVGTGTSVYGITRNSLESMELFTPSIEEQQKIGFFLKEVDEKIYLQQSKINKTKDIKSAYLSDMFPKEGEKYPKKRFEGYTEPWEKVELGEIINSYSGGTPSVGKKDYYKGNIPFIRSGEIHGHSTKLFINEVALSESSAKMVSKGNILYALYGATSGEVSISKINGAINQAVLAIIPNNGYDANFLMQSLKKEKENILNKYLQGGQGNLSGSIIKSIELQIPSETEQNKISKLFNNLDAQIDLEEQKLNKLQQLKQAYLNELFV